MPSVRTRTLAVGSAVAVTAGLLADHGAALGADLPRTALFGAAAGAVLGLVPDRTPAWRAGGFAVGFAAAWAGYALRAGVLPDIPMGRAIAAVAVVAVITAFATATAGRLSLWSGLLGTAALVGAYETTYALNPSAFTTESTTAATTVLVAAALAFLVTSLLQVLLEPVRPSRTAADAEREPTAAHDFTPPAPRSAADTQITEVTR